MQHLFALCALFVAAWLDVEAGICDQKIVITSSTGKWSEEVGYASRAIDDNKTPDFYKGGCSHTDSDDPNPWLLLDLGCAKLVKAVNIINRDGLTAKRLNNFVVSVHKNLPDVSKISDVCKDQSGSVPAGAQTIACDKPINGRFVLFRYKNPASINRKERYIHLCDVSVQ